MKNISSYSAVKYNNNEEYVIVEDGIYSFEDMYVTSLSFEQEPYFGEGESPQDISQYPLEDMLEEFGVRVNDFYREINKESSSLCYVEFSSPKIENIKKLRSVIGKHVYNKEDDDDFVDLIVTDYKDMAHNMVDDVFGEMSFKAGWTTKTDIELWGEKHTITVNAKASIEDGITNEQRKSYKNFKETQSDKERIIEELLSEEFKDEEDGFCSSCIPITILIKRNGSFIIFFDDADFVVTLFPAEKVLWDY
jgi:hypothetical protein